MRAQHAGLLLMQALVLALLLPAAPASGQAVLNEPNRQVDPDLLRRLERQLREFDVTNRLVVPPGQPISERLLLDFGGSVRFGLVGVDNQFGSTRVLRQTDGVVYLRGELDGAHRFFVRSRFLYNDFNSGDSFDGRGDDLVEPIVDRYWYQFDYRQSKLAQTGEWSDANFTFRGGRQYVHWGSGLALSQALYAGVFDFELSDLAIQVMGGLTPSTGTIDFDGSRPGFDEDTDRVYFGARLEYSGWTSHRPYVSFLVQRDENDRNFSNIQVGPQTFPTRFDYDSEYWAIGSRGSVGPRVTYRAEFIYETGEGLSSPFDPATGAATTQRLEDIEAMAGLLNVTYLTQDDYDTRYDFEFIGGTGDRDRLSSSDTFGGNRTGTRDRSFNSLGYANTGLALAPEVANLLSLRLGFSTSPDVPGVRRGALRVGMNGFLFAKANQSAPISVTTGAQTFVGSEINFFADWRVMSDVNINLRYGLFLPGDAMPAGQDDPRHFVYAGVTYAF